MSSSAPLCGRSTDIRACQRVVPHFKASHIDALVARGRLQYSGKRNLQHFWGQTLLIFGYNGFLIDTGCQPWHNGTRATPRNPASSKGSEFLIRIRTVAQYSFVQKADLA